MYRDKRKNKVPVTAESVKKIREQGLKDYQSKLVVIKADIAKALKEKADILADIKEKKVIHSSWVQSKSKELDVKRTETNEYVTTRKASLNKYTEGAKCENEKNEKTLAQIKVVEVATASDLRKIQVEKKDAGTLHKQSKVSEEKAVAEVKNYRALIKQSEELSIKVNRELTALQKIKDSLVKLTTTYDERVKAFKDIRKEVISIENETALKEARIDEKLNKLNDIAKAEGDEL